MQNNFNFSKIKEIISLFLLNYYLQIKNNCFLKCLSLSTLDFCYPKILILEKKYFINNSIIDKLQIELFDRNNFSEINKIVINKKNFIFYFNLT